MTGEKEKEERDKLIERLNKSCMSCKDIEKLTELINKQEKKSITFEMKASAGPSSSDIMMYGTYDIDRDVSAHWHTCTYRAGVNIECCNRRIIVSEYDPGNPPTCRGKKEDESHPFIPCEKR